MRARQSPSLLEITAFDCYFICGRYCVQQDPSSARQVRQRITPRLGHRLSTISLPSNRSHAYHAPSRIQARSRVG